MMGEAQRRDVAIIDRVGEKILAMNFWFLPLPNVRIEENIAWGDKVERWKVDATQISGTKI